MEEGFVAPDQAESEAVSDEAAPAQEAGIAAAAEESRPTVTVEDPILAPARPVAEAPVPPPAPVVPEPEPVAVVLTPPDPERPKRAGWWSKAKSVLSGS